MTDDGALEIFSSTNFMALLLREKRDWNALAKIPSDCGMSTFHRSFQTGVKTLQHVRIQNEKNDDSMPLYFFTDFEWDKI